MSYLGIAVLGVLGFVAVAAWRGWGAPRYPGEPLSAALWRLLDD